MTEHILPDDLANGLVDGTAAAGSAPGTFHGAAELLDAMRAPATPDELVGMAAFMQQFSASVTPPRSAPSAAQRTGVVHMLTTRITKRAAAMAAVTLLTAGTAAAAAGGVIPTPFLASVDDSATTSISVPGASTDDSVTSSSVDDSATSSSVDDSTSSSVEGAGAFPHDTHDLCEASQKGLASEADNAALAAQAVAMGVSVADYCMLADAAHDAGDDHGSGGHGADDAAGDDHGSGGHGADDAAGDDHGSGGHGADDAPGASTPSAGTVDDSGKNRGGKGSSTSVPVTTAPSHSTPVVSAPSNTTPVTTPASGTTDDSGKNRGGKGKGGDDTSNG